VLSGFTGISAVNFGVQGATLDLSAYSSFQASGTTSMSSGSLSLPSGADLNGALSITGGTFTAPSGTMTVAGALTISGSPTFNANGGTVTFDGSGANVTLACNNVTFAHVSFAHTVNTKVINSDCSMPIGANPTVGTSVASVTLNGTLSGSGTLFTTGTLTINTGAVLSGFSGYTATGLTVTGATFDFSSYSPFSTSGTFTVQTSANVTLPSNADINNTFNLSTSSTLNMPNGSVFFAGAVTLNSGTTFNANSGTVVIDGTSTVAVTCNSATFNAVTFAHTSGTKTVVSGCTLPLGNNPTLGGVGATTPVVVVQGTLTGSGTLTMLGTAGGGGGLRFDSTAVLTGFSAIDVQSFNVNGATLDLTGYTSVNIGATFTLSSGTFTSTQNTISLEGSLNFTGGTFNHNNGTVRFSGTQSVALLCNSVTFYKVEFTHTSSTKVIGPTCNMPLGNNPTITATGNILSHGVMSGTGTLTTQDNTTLTLQSNQAGLSGFSDFSGYNLTLAGSTIDISSFSNFTVRNDLTIENHASFKSTSGNLYVGGDMINTSGDGGLVVPGNTGQNASTVDSAALSITGDIDIRVKASLNAWARGVGQGLLAKFDATASNQRSYQLQLDSTGHLFFEASLNGSTTGYSGTSTAAVTGYDGVPVWVRSTRNATTGDIKFYTSTDGSSWSQLGTTITATAGAIFDGTAPLVVAEKNNSISPASGKFYRAQVRNNILDDGTGIVFDADFSTQADGATSFTESSSNAATVTINGTYAKISSSGAGSVDANNGTVNLDDG